MTRQLSLVGFDGTFLIEDIDKIKTEAMREENDEMENFVTFRKRVAI